MDSGSVVPPFQRGDSSVQAGGNDAGTPPPSPGGGGALTGGTTGGGVPSGGVSGGGGSGGGTSGGTFDASVTPIGNDAGASTGDGGAPSADGGGNGGSFPAGPCTRDALKALVEQYFAAFTAHDATTLPLAANVKYTENGRTVKIGEGAWKTAGAVKFKRTLIDTEICTSVTESVFDNAYSGGSGGGFLGGLLGGGGGSGGSSSSSGRADFVYGLRLKVDAGKLTEIETILVSPSDWVANAEAVINSRSDDWETPLPAEKRATRTELKKIVDDYFALFNDGSVADFPFASDCARLENGTSPGACDFGIPSLGTNMTPRVYVLDVEASVAIGFVMFAGSFDDFHMFKVRDKQVLGVHAVLVSAGSSGWD